MRTKAETDGVGALLERVGRLVGGRATKSAAHFLADVLHHEIASARVPPGTRLFDTATLQRATGLSRTVIREAMRLLQSRGLIDIRPGAGGGIYVRGCDYRPVRDSLLVLISLSGAEPIKALEARQELEALCAKLAARHANDHDLETLRDSLRRQELGGADTAHFLEENVRFHLIVAECTHNPILAGLMHSLREIVQDITMGFSYSPEALRAAFAAHQRLVAAVAARDESAAARIMLGHMQAVTEYLQRTGQI